VAKTGAERQRELTAKRTGAGWKKIWIPAALVQKVKDLIKQLEEV